MAYESESIHGIKIRVFKWIQNMIKDCVLVHHLDYPQSGSSSTRFGFLVLRVKNQIRIVKPRNHSGSRGGQTKKTTFKKTVQPFKICETPEELVESIHFALGLSDLFFKDTIPHLAKTIYDYLSSSFEFFDKNLSLLSTGMDVDRLNKIVVAIDVDMQSGRFEIGPQGPRDVYKFQLTNLYETLVNDSDNNEDSEGGFYLRVEGIQESCVGVSKKRRVDVDTETSVNGSKKRGIDVQKILALEVEYTFNDSDIQEILDTLLDFLTKKREFYNKVEVFDGKIQEFREVKSGLKIVKLKKENNVSFELGDTCPICFEIFEESSIVVITPCSHIFHRSCIFTWLSQTNTCPICRGSCDV